MCTTSPAIADGTAGEGAELGDLLPHLRGLIVEKIDCTLSAVVIRARCWPSQAACPARGVWSSRVHGSYIRQVRDLPLGGRPVLIHLAMRRFACLNAACTKTTFTRAGGWADRPLPAVERAAGRVTVAGRAGASRAGRDAADQGTGYRGASRHAAAAGHRPARARDRFCTGGAGR